VAVMTCRAIAAVLAGAEALAWGNGRARCRAITRAWRDVARTDPAPQGCRPWTGCGARGGARRLPAAEVIGESRRRTAVRPRLRAGERGGIFTGGVDSERRRRGVIQEDTCAMATASNPRGGGRAGTYDPPASIFARATCCCARAAPHDRDLSVFFLRGHELSSNWRCGGVRRSPCSPPATSWWMRAHPRPGTDRLFTACAAARWRVRGSEAIDPACRRHRGRHDGWEFAAARRLRSRYPASQGAHLSVITICVSNRRPRAGNGVLADRDAPGPSDDCRTAWLDAG